MRRLSRILRSLRNSSSNVAKPSLANAQVVSFDATDTIIAMNKPFNIVYSGVANDFGISVDPLKVASSFPKYMKKLSVSHPCFGFNSIGHFEWWRRVVQSSLQEACVHSIPQKTADDIARSLFDFYASAKAWRVVDPELNTVVNDLRQRGLGVVVVSNFDGRLTKILQDLQLYPLFDFIVASGEVGVEKPNPNIFKLVTNRYGLSNASELLHVGDCVKNDYQAAIDFGANAVLFDPFSNNSDVKGAHKITSFTQLRIQ